MDESTKRSAFVVGSYVACWTALYFLARRRWPTRSRDFSNRCVSLLHTAFGLLGPLLVLDLHNLRANVGTLTRSSELLVLQLSLGYFVYDMVCCLAIEFIENRLDVATFFHHVVTIMGLVVGVFQGISGHELLLCLLLMEASNPFMHLRSILREVGVGNSSFSAYNDIAFAISFLVCRNLLGIPVAYWAVSSPTTPLTVKAGALGVLLVSWFWTGKLLSVLKRKLLKSKKDM